MSHDNQNNFIAHISEQVRSGYAESMKSMAGAMRNPHSLFWLIGARTALDHLQRHLDELIGESEADPAIIELSEAIAKGCSSSFISVRSPVNKPPQDIISNDEQAADDNDLGEDEGEDEGECES